MFSLNNLRVKHSALLTVAALIVLTCGLWVLFHTAIPPTLLFAMTVIGIIITIHFILRHSLVFLPKSIIRVDATEGTLHLTQKNGKRIKAIPLASSFLTSKLLLLVWKPDLNNSDLNNNVYWQQLITPANLTMLTIGNVSSQEDFRRLRVLLTFGKLGKSPTITEPPYNE